MFMLFYKIFYNIPSLILILLNTGNKKPFANSSDEGSSLFLLGYLSADKRKFRNFTLVSYQLTDLYL